MKAFQSVRSAALAAVLMSVCGVAAADRDQFLVELDGFQEVPAVSTTASGSFFMTLDDATGSITYELLYTGLTGEVRQAHIHFGQRSVNGGVSVFLCQSTTNPDPTNRAPMCTSPSGRITGVLTSANIVGPGGQGIAATELGELIAAIRAGIAYVNVHTATYGGGEVRGQFDGRSLGNSRKPPIGD